MKITTEELFVLYRDMIRLFPNTTIEDFSEIIEQDGYWDTKTRINIRNNPLKNYNHCGLKKGSLNQTSLQAFLPQTESMRLLIMIY